jgi:HK97 family phage prohead protease
MPVGSPTLERKTASGRFEIKATGPDQWEVSGFASTFGTKDSPKSAADFYGDIVLAGSFKNAVKAPSRVKFLSEHGATIGTTLELRETARGLYGRWAIVDTQAGTDAYKLAKAGAYDALSIGFFPVDYEYRDDQIRLISSVELLEVSLTGIPANRDAVVTSVKSGAAAMPVPAPVDLSALGSRLQKLGVDVTGSGTSGTLGQQVVAAREVRQLLAGQRQLAVVSDLDVRALISSGGLGTAITPPALRPDLMVPPAPPRVLDYFQVEPATSGSIMVPVSSGMSGALAVAEATAASGTSGSKSEGTITWTNVVQTLSTIACWVPATTRALADASTLRSQIDGELRQAVLTRLEHDALEGSGSAGEMTGLWGLAGATEVVATGAANALGSIARAIGRVNESGRAASVVAISAATYSALLEANASAALGQTFALGGVPLVPTPGLTAGRALAIAGGTVVLWARPLSILIGMAGSDFLKNIRRLLAEVDATVNATRPTSVCRVSGLPT